MDFKFIKFELEQDVCAITLNRPDVLNSFNTEMGLELQELLDHCATHSDIRAISITGEGRAFCAGQDLAEAISGKFEIEQIVRNTYNPIITKIRNIPKPVIAAVNGVAAGAGANIALSCDIVIASDNSSFIQSFSSIGLIPDSAGTYFLPRLVGIAKATTLTMLGEKISASEAENIGMIYKSVPKDEFERYVSELSVKLAKMPTYGLALTKKALNASFENSLDNQLNLEAELQKLAGESYDYKEGVNSFLEKRKPTFIGK
ncbi:2-(1,2-epoxy-1,2-dihydrophenyl)acetyl-CoA isomerase PaaG [Candidatus Kapaibacterium sp.]